MSFQPIMVPSVTLTTLANIITDLKTIASRNQLISKTSIAQGFETNLTAGPFAEGFDSTYATSTSVSGTLSYPQTLVEQSRWTTIVTLNQGLTPGTTVVNVNGGIYTATDETILYSKTTGVGTNFKLCLFQVPIGFANLLSVNVTFNKASSTGECNAQIVQVLPGKWSGVSNALYGGGTGATAGGRSTTSLSVTTNDLVITVGGLDRTDPSIPTITHSGPANTKVIETNAAYNSVRARQFAINVMDAAGTFVTDTQYTSVTVGGGGHGGGTTTTYYYYSNFVQSLRFVQP